MFPKSIFFFIFLILLNSVLKSLKEKGKIEREKAERSVNKPLREIRIPKEKKSTKVEKTSRVEKVRPLEMSSLEGNFLEDENVIRDEIGKGDLTRRENSFKPKKEDILKGIIYSEILSKPKSLR